MLEDRLKKSKEEHQRDLRELKEVEATLFELRKEKELLLHNGDERNDELRRLRLSDVNQKTTISSLNSTIHELNRSLTEKDQEINCLHRQIEVTKSLNESQISQFIRYLICIILGPPPI